MKNDYMLAWLPIQFNNVHMNELIIAIVITTIVASIAYNIKYYYIVVVTRSYQRCD